MLAAAPAEVRHSTQQRGIVYTLARDVVAAHHAGAGGRLAPGHRAGPVTIMPAGEAPAARGVVLGPVYRRRGGGGLVVPTGIALVRFGEGDRAERHREKLAAAGYEIEQALPYAPHAASVRAHSAEITDALRGLVQLEQLPGVNNVEPQLLSEAARRG